MAVVRVRAAGFVHRATLTLLLALAPLGFAGAVTYLSPTDFVASAFGDPVQPQVLWLTGKHQGMAKTILGHTYAARRLRYWQAGKRTAWVLDEIGKERPITMGIIVEDGVISNIRILSYRETRGGEVRHPFFLDQFTGLGLTDEKRLNGPVDGISGATLSVRAVTNVGRYALYLDKAVRSAAP